MKNILIVFFFMAYAPLSTLAQIDGYGANRQQGLRSASFRQISYRSHLFEGGMNFNLGKLAEHAPFGWGLSYTSEGKADNWGLGYSVGFNNNIIKNEKIVTSVTPSAYTSSYYDETASILSKYNWIFVGGNVSYQFEKETISPCLGASVTLQFQNTEYHNIVDGNYETSASSLYRGIGFQLTGGAVISLQDDKELTTKLSYGITKNEALGNVHTLLLRIGYGILRFQ